MLAAANSIDIPALLASKQGEPGTLIAEARLQAITERVARTRAAP